VIVCTCVRVAETQLFPFIHSWSRRQMLCHIASFLLALAVSALPVEEYGASLLQSSKDAAQVVLAKEHHDMLQHLANAGGKPTKELYLNLQQMTADLAAREKNFSKELLVVIDIVLDYAQSVIDAEVNATSDGQKEIDDAYDSGTSYCNDSFGVSDDTWKVERTSHSNCRSREQTVITIKNESCSEFYKVEVNQKYPPCVYKEVKQDDGSTLYLRADVTLDCMKTLSDWLQHFQKEFEEKEDKCNNATEEVEHLDQHCDDEQRRFENARCLWDALASQNYNTYSSCYDHLRESYAAEVSRVEGRIKTSKALYSVAYQTKCLLVKLKENPNNVSKVVKTMGTCEYVDKSMFVDLNVRTIPANEDLNGSPVGGSIPCDEQWMQEEYRSQPWYDCAFLAPCHACDGTVSSQEACSTEPECCKICDEGKACGDTCISKDMVCHTAVGCACNAS